MHHQTAKELDGFSQIVRVVSKMVRVWIIRLVGSWHGCESTGVVDDHLWSEGMDFVSFGFRDATGRRTLIRVQGTCQ